MSKEKINILVIDDEEGIRSVLKFMLEDAGYAVDTAINGKDGISKFPTKKYDLVFTDMKMPEASGLEVINFVKDYDPSCEIIVITAYGTIGDAVTAIKSGAAEYILKPFEEPAIFLAIEKALERKKLNRQVQKCAKLRGLGEASRAVAISLPLDEFLDRILRIACESSGADSGSIMIYNETNKTLKIGAAFSLSPDISRTARVAFGNRISGRVIRDKVPLLIQNGLKDYPEFNDVEARSDIKSSICIPLLTNDRIIGVLNVSRTRNENLFSEDDLSVLTIFAADIALNIDNTRIQNELLAKNRELSEANEKLHELAKLKSEFVSNVSHELRTPLTALTGAIDLLVSGLKDLPVTDKKLADIALNNSVTLEKMIDDILDFSRMEAGKVKTDKDFFDMSILVSEAMEDLKPLIVNKKLELKITGIDKEHKVLADRKQIKQVLTNFINNAVKFTEKGSITAIIEKENDDIIVCIKDTGIGILEEDKPRVFERFYRGDNSQVRKTTGFGIGLSLCKYLIEEGHSGKIWFISKKGQGSEFYFLIPGNINK